jgi:hypothetical protein
MKQSNVPSQRDIFDAVRGFGYATGAGLSQKERHWRAIAEAERSRLLQQAVLPISDRRILGGIRRALGGALVRTGLRLQGASAPTIAAAPR